MKPRYAPEYCPCDGMRLGCTDCNAVVTGAKVKVTSECTLRGHRGRMGHVVRLDGIMAWVRLEPHGATPRFWLSDLVLTPVRVSSSVRNVVSGQTGTVMKLRQNPPRADVELTEGQLCSMPLEELSVSIW